MSILKIHFYSVLFCGFVSGAQAHFLMQHLNEVEWCLVEEKVRTQTDKNHVRHLPVSFG